MNTTPIEHQYQTYSNLSMNVTSESVDTTTAIPSFYCKDGMRLYRFIMEVVAGLPIEVFGFVGNVLAFIVLYRQHSKGATNLLLQALALMDSLYLLCSIKVRAIRYIHSCTKLVDSAMFYYVYSHIFLIFYPVMYMLRLVITWLTVWLTVDRWIAVCRPLHAQRLVSRRNVWIQIVGTVVLATLLVIPRYFEYRLEVLSDTTHIRPNAFVQNKYYAISYNATTFLIIMFLLPMSILVTFNVLLTRALKDADKTRESLRIHHNTTTSTQRNQSANRSLTLIVVFVTATFLVCNIPPLLSQLLYAVRIAFPASKFISTVNRWRQVFTNISNMMVIVNSAVNFIIYCACSQKFRTTFMQMWPCIGPVKKRQPSTYASIKSMKGTLVSSLSVKSSTRNSDLNLNNLKKL